MAGLLNGKKLHKIRYLPRKGDKYMPNTGTQFDLSGSDL